MSSSFEIGKRLVDLCSKGKNAEAIDTLYAQNVVSIEAHANPAFPNPRFEGLAAVKGKNEWWTKNHEIHSSEVGGPWPHGDKFIVTFKYDVTAKAGQMAGHRMQMEEAALFTVKGDKIVQEEFFYHMG